MDARIYIFHFRSAASPLLIQHSVSAAKTNERILCEYTVVTQDVTGARQLNFSPMFPFLFQMLHSELSTQFLHPDIFCLPAKHCGLPLLSLIYIKSIDRFFHIAFFAGSLHRSRSHHLLLIGAKRVQRDVDVAKDFDAERGSGGALEQVLYGFGG